MKDSLLRLVLRMFGLVPTPMAHRLVALTSPSYRIGTVAVIISDDARLLLVRHTYRKGWGLPGGMIGWHEEPADTIKREMHEEVSLSVKQVGPSHIEHARRPRRVEWFFDLTLDGCEPEDATISSPEIAELRWFALDDLPVLEKKHPPTQNALREIAGRRFPGLIKL